MNQTEDEIRKQTQAIPQVVQQAAENEPQKNTPLYQRAGSIFKNFDIKITKTRLLALTASIFTLLLIYLGLVLFSQKPQVVEKIPEKVIAREEINESSKSAEFIELEKKVSGFNTKIDNLENFRSDFSPPQPELNVFFK